MTADQRRRDRTQTIATCDCDCDDAVEIQKELNVTFGGEFHMARYALNQSNVWLVVTHEKYVV